MSNRVSSERPMERVLSTLAEALTAEFGKGFSATNLKLMRQFYMVYTPRIGQTVPDQSAPEPATTDAKPVIGQAPHTKLDPFPCFLNTLL